MAPALVVVTGPPGAGKSAIAEALRTALGFPLVAKDAVKESLGGSLGITEPVESRRLGTAVFELIPLLLRELLAARVSVVVEGNFAVGSPVFDGLPPARVVQVHVTADPLPLDGPVVRVDTTTWPELGSIVREVEILIA